MKTVLITGANRGLGLEFTSQYAKAGWQVFATCRHSDGANALSKIAYQYSNIHIYQADMAEQSSLEALATQLGEQAIDLLILNAGVYGGSPQLLGELERDTWRHTLEINAIAPIMLAQQLLPNIGCGDERKVVFITSKMGSVSDNSSGQTYYYRSSKAALNAAVKSFAHDVAVLGIKVGLIHPGWVQTAMGGPNALINAEASIGSIMQVIEQLDMASSGKFVDYLDREIAW